MKMKIRTKEEVVALFIKNEWPMRKELASCETFVDILKAATRFELETFFKHTVLDDHDNEFYDSTREMENAFSKESANLWAKHNNARAEALRAFLIEKLETKEETAKDDGTVSPMFQ